MYSGQNVNEYLERLMGSEGERMLDMEISRAREEAGDEKFKQYATEFFEELSLSPNQFQHLLGNNKFTPAPEPTNP